MNAYLINNIDEIIAALDKVISEAEKNNDTSGYFATVYRKATLRIKEEIVSGQFENSSRIEKISVFIARNYFEAHSNFINKKPVTISWRKAFRLSKNSHPIVLQHLLMGINAQMNLDLGVAIAEVAKGKSLDELEADFNHIYGIFATVLREVQDNISSDWLTLKLLLKITGAIDKYLFDHIIADGRDETWRFANHYATISKVNKSRAFSFRDQEVAAKTEVILNPRLMDRFIFRLIHITETGSVARKIKKMEQSAN